MNNNSNNNETKFYYDSLNKRCSGCGNFYRYSPDKGCLACSYCGNTIPLEETQMTKELPFNKEVIEECCRWVGGVLVKCESCGATFELHTNSMSENCPFCGTGHVIETKQIPGIQPTGVCPFLVDEDKVLPAFKNSFSGRSFVQKNITALFKDIRINGIYFPVFTFDCDTVSPYELHYATRHTRTVTRNGHTHTETYYSYHVGTGTIYHQFDDVTSIALRNEFDNNFHKIFNFDTNNASSFHEQFLAGYSAYRYDISIESSWDSACNIMDDTIKSLAIDEHNGVDRVESFDCDTSYYDVTYKYILVPVYTITYKFKNKQYTAFMNGENGIISGPKHLSAGKIALFVIVMIIIVAAVIGLFYYFRS